MQHRHHGLGDLRVVIVGEDINEVSHALVPAAWALGPAVLGGAAQEATFGEDRQMPLARDAEELLQQPAHRWACQSRVHDHGKRAGERCEVLGARQRPVHSVEAMLGDVGGLHFEHELAGMHVGRTLAVAHPAVHTEVGDLAYFIR